MTRFITLLIGIATCVLVALSLNAGNNWLALALAIFGIIWIIGRQRQNMLLAFGGAALMLFLVCATLVNLQSMPEFLRTPVQPGTLMAESGTTTSGNNTDGTTVLVVEQPNPTVTPSSTPAPTATNSSECAGADAPAASYSEFDPVANWDWDELNAQQQPTFDEFLTAHNLSRSDIQSFTPQSVSWEPAMYVVELTEDNYGKVRVPLIEGWVYTLALVDQSVEVMWGGDPDVSTACLQWGFTARWVGSYDTNASDWLDPANGLELVAREYRFGRYLRNTEMDPIRSDVVYFDRVGPYYTGSGNVNVDGWVPPSLDATIPSSWQDACAMLGGLCVESEWSYGEAASGGFLNWAWRYSARVDGSGTYCPQGDPCWQTVYHPDGNGYVELWLSQGTTGPNGSAVSQSGPYKFYEGTNVILADGRHNVDQFSYHADPDR